MRNSARKYNKQVEIWQTTPVSDGFSGSHSSEELITKTWAHIRTMNFNYRRTEEGITQSADKLVFTLRKRNDLTYNALNMYIKYRGYRYDIQETPLNKGFEDSEIEIVGIRESVKRVI